MSNPNTPFGFQELGWNRGGPAVTGATVERKIAAGYGTAIGRGDAVQSLTSGYIARGAAGVSGSNTAGIFIGCKYLSTSMKRMVFAQSWPTGDHAYDGTAFIIPIQGVPPKLFKVQTLLTNLTIASIGQTIDIDAGTVNSQGFSTMTVSAALLGGTGGAPSLLPFRVVDLYSSIAPYGVPGTDDTSNYNIVIVSSNPDYEATI